MTPQWRAGGTERPGPEFAAGGAGPPGQGCTARPALHGAGAPLQGTVLQSPGSSRPPAGAATSCLSVSTPSPRPRHSVGQTLLPQGPAPVPERGRLASSPRLCPQLKTAFAFSPDSACARPRQTATSLSVQLLPGAQTARLGPVLLARLWLGKPFLSEKLSAWESLRNDTHDCSLWRAPASGVEQSGRQMASAREQVQASAPVFILT